MANTTVSATRMELTRLKGRLKTATRGHKLLKDKRDELMKQFLDVVRENREIRQRVEEGLKQAHASFTVASALMSAEMLEQSLLYPKQSVELGMTTKNIMSVNVPLFSYEIKAATKSGEGGDDTDIYPYGFAYTTADLDLAVEESTALLPLMIRLAEVEKTADMLADEIEKTRRRVNALEYIMIPQFEAKIKEITLKLEENERGNTTRLMKVKDMMLQAQYKN